MSLSVSMHIWNSEDNAPVHCFHEVDPRDQVVKNIYIMVVFWQTGKFILK